MIPKMKNLNLMMKVVMVDLIKLVTQTYRTNLLSNQSAINNHPNSRKEQKITGKQELPNQKKTNLKDAKSLFQRKIKQMDIQIGKNFKLNL